MPGTAAGTHLSKVSTVIFATISASSSGASLPDTVIDGLSKVPSRYTPFR